MIMFIKSNPSYSYSEGLCNVTWLEQLFLTMLMMGRSPSFVPSALLTFLFALASREFAVKPHPNLRNVDIP